jgi:hypothetical protein
LFLNWFVINLRFIIGFGFLPSGIKKILGNPFANPGQEGAFMEYLDALFATGLYYEVIGWAQVIAAVLLITQRYSTIGAILFLPIIFNIMVLTISTIGSLTPVIATLMFLGILFLMLWDYYKWINIFSSDNKLISIPSVKDYPTAGKFWIRTGIIALIFPFLAILIISMFQNSKMNYGNVTGLFLGIPVVIMLIANLTYFSKIIFLKKR